ncbi:torsin-1A-like [Sinocyclocheilus grahami]|uniref:torsin-1A-like n=1 Tax=Sinocyclocheilus grahami TaxID=75366 RepID=UPI0007ACC666|nr:PREDICTED: torsin-1A-like [Sinocyclocheilus grahami]
MKSGTFLVLFFLLPVATEAGFWDFFNVFSKDDDLLSFNSSDLEKDLRKSLFGQHIAVDTVLKAVSWFMKDPDPPKPLVLSFHGPTGVGKNYISKIIARNIYKVGLKSNHVHIFISDYHFPHKEEAEMYELQLRQWIHGNVSNFPRSMFIFDEMDRMHPRLIDTLKPFLDNNDNVDGVSFNKAIFIFLSQTGGHIITNVTLDFWRKGNNREELQLQSEEMETQIFEYLFNDENNGLWHSSLINQHLIDHYIPFLPLEVKHVHQCVMAEMLHLNMTQDYDLADRVVRDMPVFPEEEKVFAVKGCRCVRQKLVLYLSLD